MIFYLAPALPAYAGNRETSSEKFLTRRTSYDKIVVVSVLFDKNPITKG